MRGRQSQSEVPSSNTVTAVRYLDGSALWCSPGTFQRMCSFSNWSNWFKVPIRPIDTNCSEIWWIQFGSRKSSICQIELYRNVCYVFPIEEQNSSDHWRFSWIHSLNSALIRFNLPPGCYHSANKIHVRDRVFKLRPIHDSVIYQISRIQWIQWKFCFIWYKLYWSSIIWSTGFILPTFGHRPHRLDKSYPPLIQGPLVTSYFPYLSNMIHAMCKINKYFYSVEN